MNWNFSAWSIRNLIGAIGLRIDQAEKFQFMA